MKNVTCQVLFKFVQIPAIYIKLTGKSLLTSYFPVMELERFIPVMTPDELRMFERQVREGEKADFSPDTIQSWRERLNVREREINVKFATAAAKSDELCRQKTAKR